MIEVDAATIAATGYGYAQLAIAETVDDPVVSSVLVILSEPRYAPNTASQVD